MKGGNMDTLEELRENLLKGQAPKVKGFVLVALDGR